MSERQDPTPAALYARVSSDRQDVDLSIAAQLRALRDYADKNGYLIAREYVDEAQSGRVADRPEFRKMIDEASRPESPFHEILVWKFSRFTRKREHAVAFKSMLRRKGIRVVSITEQAEDTSTGRLLEGIIESVDEFYSENLAQEVLRGMREAASRGFWVASRTPYGYNRVMVQDGPKKRPTLEPDPTTVAGLALDQSAEQVGASHPSGVADLGCAGAHQLVDAAELGLGDDAWERFVYAHRLGIVLCFRAPDQSASVDLVLEDGVDAGLAPELSCGAGDALVVEGASDVSHPPACFGHIEDALEDGCTGRSQARTPRAASSPTTSASRS